ncbi:hypothetical protein [Duganella violaceipulchra]|uniref:Lipoprotein n=1 Tax=Duganella violaceipulchra TaxID=2849652 RepID=A0AA41HBA5_9BURK|nr:hypothetical protein [Duganella violaceicalia]MBV6324210.1 hypothetical protein [Duganella violaceicalia]MCP2011857.1 hypothetical protein [Duganella violaceicalia]
MNNSMKAALLAVVAGLAGCNGSTSNEPPPPSSVPVLGEGALQGYANGDTVSGASIYTNKDGKGYVLLSADGDGAATVIHVVDGSKGRRVPVASSGMVTLAYDRTQAVVLNALSGANAAGSYQVLIGGKPVLFTVAADGAISAGASDCKLTGKVDFTATYGGAAALTLTASGCGSAVEGSYKGLALASADTAPAALQLVGENGSAVLDLLAYR